LSNKKEENELDESPKIKGKTSDYNQLLGGGL
jgi:hypothetical protein